MEWFQNLKILNKFIDLCKRIDFTECNITSIPIYGSTNVRVRTEFEDKPSYWINITFTPYTDTNIGPPAVQIGTTKPGVLNVQLTDPFFIRDGSKSSLRDLYGSILYRLLIWKKDGGEQVRNESINHTFQRISDLDPGTKYCLKAQAFIEGLDKSGEWSEDVCIRTASSTNTGINPVQLTILLLSVLISLAFCCFIIFRVYRCTKYAFFPSYSLPQHFKEFLSKPSYSSQFLSSHSQGEDHDYDKIIVLSEELRDGNNVSEEQLSDTKDQFQKSQENASRPKVVPDCMLLEYP
ncbi:interleukin-10 receptor subunit beta isoform X2 [Varanus komodoensis]|uniref:interleukin-10 receptor subunit beta isoform X2 n=1 Tax=Varanus komodoensis TaxID=61221 RepID=UPI001CF7CD0F|nr:interleukin-10 receptor subunit beta isoform X2 [Varanus komodoensis]